MSAVARLQQAWSSTFFVVEQLLTSASHADRAAILLRLSDDMITAKAEQIQDACNRAGFLTGSDYVHVRLAQQCRQRDADGTYPADMIEQAEFWRRALVAIAGGGS